MMIHPIALFIAVPIVALTLAGVYFLRASTMVREQRRVLAGKDEGMLGKARTIGYWASSIGVSILFIIAGLPKINDLGETFHQFAHWGYPEAFLTFIGITEVVAAIFLLLPRTSKYAAGYLSVIMVGAIYTHLAFDPLPYVFLPTVVLAFLAFVLYEDLNRGEILQGRVTRS